MFGTSLEAATTDRFALQNDKMLRVHLDGEVLARQGSMVAYQGEMSFAHQGSGGVQKFLKKAFTGEGVPLMKVTGRGDLFLADDASEVHVVTLEGDSITVSGRNVLAFDTSLQWDIRRVEGASMMAGGLFNTVFTGVGQLAITSFGPPVILDVDQPTYADAQSAIAWSSTLQTAAKSSMSAGALVGRGSGEAMQIAFSGQGFVIVQASEGPRIVQQNG
ncbi:AIM24 family protein [Cellulomonas septica]|uniref:AIM24 family protein n=2 Tax=Cellulomonas septica TaxID=285080 RepID=A0ABX1K076_9CELL|nr:AIM24 family protein [Cellulomonas septica]NKY38982.1 AIM24 family protein [Cellulomonas septica]